MTTVKEINKNDIFTEAEDEVIKEAVNKAKLKYKHKLYERIQATKILTNINRELEELKLEIQHDLEH